jgi:uncharacterized membrane protein
MIPKNNCVEVERDVTADSGYRYPRSQKRDPGHPTLVEERTEERLGFLGSQDLSIHVAVLFNRLGSSGNRSSTNIVGEPTKPGYNRTRSTSRKVLMLTPTNIWMEIAGLVYLMAGVLVLRKDIGAARGLDKLITLGPVFIAVSLATFAPEHFRGPEFVKNMVPSYMPGQAFWAYLVGCALLAAATSLTFRRCVRLSTTLLGLMFFLFVCMLYLPSVLTHASNRFAWAILFRDLSFCAGGWALAGLHGRASWPQLSKWMVSFARFVIATAAIVFAAHHFLHPEFAPGVPLELKMPTWVPFPIIWGYLTGLILLVSGIGLALNKKSRLAAGLIGALMTVLTLVPYMVILTLARDAAAVNEGLNYVADTLLYAGSALALAAALPREPEGVGMPAKNG